MDIEIDLGVMGKIECCVAFKHYKAEPASIDGPGVDESFIIDELRYRGINIYPLFDNDEPIIKAIKKAR
jgi:hypothetical protein